jgi:predicted HTH transcriptional regulator
VGFELHDARALLESLRALPRETDWVEFKTNMFDAISAGQYVSGLANSAMFERQKHAYIVWGVHDETHEIVGTKLRLDAETKGNEAFLLFLAKYLRPKINVNHLGFDVEGKHIEMLVIEPGYIRPVSFQGREYVRVGTSLKPLADFTEKQRALWQITSSYSFEAATISSHMSPASIFQRFDVARLLRSLGAEDRTKENARDLLAKHSLIRDNMQGGYEVFALLAICAAKNLNDFPLLEHRGARVITYKGKDKLEAIDDTEGQRGYLVTFESLLAHIMARIPSEEQILHGVRRRVHQIPEGAVREFLANALIHQDFTIKGDRPLIEIYKDRVRFINPGCPLIDVERFIDGGTQSRNPSFARLMRLAGLCEQRGSGVDRAVREIERAVLPPPLFATVEGSTSVTVFMPRRFADMTPEERVRACFQHAQVCHERNEPMSNGSLRARFGLPDKQISQVSIVIRDAIAAGKIKPLNEDQANRNARYVPSYA